MMLKLVTTVCMLNMFIQNIASDGIIPAANDDDSGENKFKRQLDKTHSNDINIVLINDGDTKKCSGILLNNNSVLTSARCCQRKYPNIKFGMINPDNQRHAQSRSVNRSIIHDKYRGENYTEDSIHNLCVIQPDKPFIIENFTSFLTLNKDLTQLHTPGEKFDGNMFSYGHGKTYLQSTHISYSVLSNDYEKHQPWANKKTFVHKKIEAGKNSTLPPLTRGDSGGPLVDHLSKIIAIVDDYAQSFQSNEDGEVSNFYIFPSIAYNADFITKALESTKLKTNSKESNFAISSASPSSFMISILSSLLLVALNYGKI